MWFQWQVIFPKFVNTCAVYAHYIHVYIYITLETTYTHTYANIYTYIYKVQNNISINSINSIWINWVN